MKKLLAIVLSLVVVMGLCACSEQNSKDNNSNNLNTTKINTNDWKDYKFIINGAEIEFGKTKPSDISDELGEFTHASSFLPFSKEYEPKSAYKGSFLNLQNKFAYSDFSFANTSTETQQAQECIICGVDFERTKIGDLEDIEIILPGNLDFETCKIDDLIKVYGDATNIFDNGEYIERTYRHDWKEIDKGIFSVLVNEDGFLLELSYDLYDIKYN